MMNRRNFLKFALRAIGAAVVAKVAPKGDIVLEKKRLAAKDVSVKFNDNWISTPSNGAHNHISNWPQTELSQDLMDDIIIRGDFVTGKEVKWEGIFNPEFIPLEWHYEKDGTKVFDKIKLISV